MESETASEETPTMNDDTTTHATDEKDAEDRTPTSRRTFIKAAGASAGALTLGASAASAQDVPTIVTELADEQVDPGETTTATVSLEDAPVGSAGVNVTLEVDPDVALITEVDINNSLLEIELNDEIEEAGGGVDSILLPRIADIEESEVEVGTYHIEAQEEEGETTLELDEFALTDPDSDVIREANYDAPTLTVGEPDDEPSPPSTPTDLEVVSTSESSIEVDWSADANAASYNVYLDGSLEDETSSAGATLSGLEADTEYEIGVSAVGDDGDETDTETVTATTDEEDDEPPETTTVTVDLADNEIESGETTTVDLGLSEAPDGLLGFTVDLTIDDSVVSIADADISDTFPDTSEPISYVDIDGDTVRLSAIEPLDPGTTDIDFGHVELEGEDAGETDIDVEIVRIEDLDDEDIEADVESATLSVDGEEPPETPTITVDPADDEIDTGDTTTVDLGLSEAPDGLLGFTVDLTVDDSVASIADADISEPFPDTSEPISYVDIDGDTVRLSAIEPLDPGTTDIDFGYVELEGEAGGETDLDVEIVRIEDLDDEDIDADVESATLSVDGEPVDESPVVPEDLDVAETTESSIEVSWSADANAASFNVYVDGTLDSDTTTSSATVTGLDDDTEYEVGVSAVDDDGDETDTATVTATTDEDDPDPGEPGDYSEWESDVLYEEGERVSWEGEDWEAKWTNQGQEPEYDINGAWEPLDGEIPLEDDLAELEPSSTSVSAGDRLEFSVTDTSPNDAWIASLEWDFGDGTTASGWWNDHTYDSSGTYTVTLTATDQLDRQSTDEVEITVS
ncbi:PKD domain-containing protein [Natronolimnobius sp. AArcel1]|uniref:fibronectin type III domain-containing protein n=1 Tax=Natronolimnobius sp. AArcel1 TaxID=1679093 RepID=UPI0013EB389D|nr:PKD domain-containing protein [Natronolimnobius sp. AArcel1]NGM68840.1 PKD domain-containing protein [Natronolimnobius sp. AArcel1]